MITKVFYINICIFYYTLFNVYTQPSFSIKVFKNKKEVTNYSAYIVLEDDDGKNSVCFPLKHMGKDDYILSVKNIIDTTKYHKFWVYVFYKNYYLAQRSTYKRFFLPNPVRVSFNIFRGKKGKKLLKIIAKESGNENDSLYQNLINSVSSKNVIISNQISNLDAVSYSTYTLKECKRLTQMNFSRCLSQFPMKK